MCAESCFDGRTTLTPAVANWWTLASLPSLVSIQPDAAQCGMNYFGCHQCVLSHRAFVLLRLRFVGVVGRRIHEVVDVWVYLPAGGQIHAHRPALVWAEASLLEFVGVALVAVYASPISGQCPPDVPDEVISAEVLQDQAPRPGVIDLAGDLVAPQLVACGGGQNLGSKSASSLLQRLPN